MATEKRLIDANALKANFVVLGEFAKDLWHAATIRSAIDNTPTVDAVEVVHGRWEKAEYHGFIRCDQCKDVYINEEWLEDGKWNYCPNCGAKMDGDGNG